MDLQTIGKKLESSSYTSIWQYMVSVPMLQLATHHLLTPVLG